MKKEERIVAPDLDTNFSQQKGGKKDTLEAETR